MQGLYIIIYNPNNSISKYPSNLTYLHIKLNSINIENFNNFNNLPPTLKILVINGCKNKFNNSLNNLPESLEYLKIIDYYDNLDNLPKFLKKLCIINNKSKLDNLPDSLETLEIINKSTRSYKKPYSRPCNDRISRKKHYNIKLDNLPQNLLNFSFYHHKYPYELVNLPDSIQTLYINDISITKIPLNIQNIIFIANIFVQHIPKYYTNKYIENINIKAKEINPQFTETQFIILDYLLYKLSYEFL